MSRPEFNARLVVAVAVLAGIGIPLVVWARTPVIHARMADSGGWSPEILKAKVGQPLHLRLTSDDVMHGFAVGQMALPSVDIAPGKVSDATLTFDKPGTYTFYCTRWCGLNHWRMRGTIEVSGGSESAAAASQPPLYVSLGIDLDAPHNAPSIPSEEPKAGPAAPQSPAGLAAFQSAEYYRAHSPYQVWQKLRGTSALSNVSDRDLWSLTASIWRSNTTPEALSEGQQLFAQNCAACHGERGDGNGVFADELASAGAASTQGMASTGNMTMQTPANFTDASRMLGANPALLQGKILRGGMGTGMPSWGPIFTESQTWDLVAYLYTFQFNYHWRGGS
jgi:mono/diheme cytochrome c family protein/plastocyanin